MKVEEALEHSECANMPNPRFETGYGMRPLIAVVQHFVTWADIPPGKQSIVQII